MKLRSMQTELELEHPLLIKFTDWKKSEAYTRGSILNRNNSVFVQSECTSQLCGKSLDQICQEAVEAVKKGIRFINTFR